MKACLSDFICLIRPRLPRAQRPPERGLCAKESFRRWPRGACPLGANSRRADWNAMYRSANQDGLVCRSCGTVAASLLGRKSAAQPVGAALKSLRVARLRTKNVLMPVSTSIPVKHLLFANCSMAVNSGLNTKYQHHSAPARPQTRTVAYCVEPRRLTLTYRGKA